MSSLCCVLLRCCCCVVASLWVGCCPLSMVHRSVLFDRCSLVFVGVRCRCRCCWWWWCWWWWMCGAACNSHRLCVVVALVVVTEHCRRSCGPVRQSRCTSRPVSGLSRVYLYSVYASLQTWCMAYLHSPVIPYHWLPSSPSCSSVFRRLCLLCSTRPGCGRPSMALQSSLR